MNRLANVKQVKRFIYIVLTLLFLLGTQHVAVGSTIFHLTMQTLTSIDTPLLTFQNITNSFIYVNNTSAKVTVSNSTSSLDVLQILNQTNDDWQLQLIKYDDANIARLTNCTIWFHNETTTSVQIKIADGIYTQTSGDLYGFTINTNITITVTTNVTGTSLVRTHLKILKPETSTYFLYTITFEITD